MGNNCRNNNIEVDNNRFRFDVDVYYFIGNYCCPLKLRNASNIRPQCR